MLRINRPISFRFLRKPVRLSILCFCLTALTGCAVGPNYKPSQTDVSGKWVGSAGQAQAQNIAEWWTTFGDPNLTSLIERAVKSNLDLKQAQLRIRQARAARGGVASGFWPAADLTGSLTRSRSGAASASNFYQAGLDAIWELDIFGGVRRNIEAAEADVQVALEYRRDVLVTLTAEVALYYIDLRGYQQQIIIAQNNLNAQRHSAELTRQRFEGGFVGALDVANANAQVATTASQIPLLEAFVQQTIYSLSVLLGQEPAALLDELMPTSTIPAAPPSVPAGVPSDLLRRRPDIRRAEAQIHAETARIGVAVADLFPKVSLSGSVSFRDSKFSSLTDGKNRFWSFGPSIALPIFSAGRIQSNIELQKAVQEQSFITYKQTVLTALLEVENALVASIKEQEHRNALIEAVANNRKAMELATKLYTEGQTDFLNVLTAQGALYSSEDALVRSNRTVSTNLVVLYKALGGGWDNK